MSAELDALVEMAKAVHPLTHESAGIPAEYCIVPRLDVLHAVDQARDAERWEAIVGAAEIWRHWWLKTHGRTFLAGDPELESILELRDAAEAALEHEVSALTAAPAEVAVTS